MRGVRKRLAPVVQLGVLETVVERLKVGHREVLLNLDLGFDVFQNLPVSDGLDSLPFPGLEFVRKR